MIPFVMGKGLALTPEDKLDGLDATWLYDMLGKYCEDYLKTYRAPFVLNGQNAELRMTACKHTRSGLFLGTFEVTDVFTLYLTFTYDSRKGKWADDGSIQTKPARIQSFETVFYGDNTIDDLIHSFVMFRMTGWEE